MTREDLLKKLSALKQLTDDRVEIWRVVIQHDGTPGQRIYCGSFRVSQPSQHER